MEQDLQAALVKVGVFVLVQALVYLILAQSSTVFSRTKSFGARRPARSLSMLGLLSDMPAAGGEGEPSPVAGAGARSPVHAAHWKED